MATTEIRHCGGLMFQPRLDILPAAQRRLWDEFGSTPKDFVLYGGTALALRLGHRVSEDFDFFSSQSFAADDLLRWVPYLKGARVDQFQPDTLTCAVDRDGEVKISFFGGLDNLKRVADPDPSPGTGVPVASLIDVAGMKCRVVQVRAAYKDYFDIATLLESGAVDLATALAAAQAIHGAAFNPMVTLKALSYFSDGDLARLSPAMQKILLAAVKSLDLAKLPVLTGRVGLAKGEQ